MKTLFYALGIVVVMVIAVLLFRAKCSCGGNTVNDTVIQEARADSVEQARWRGRGDSLLLSADSIRALRDSLMAARKTVNIIRDETERAMAGGSVLVDIDSLDLLPIDR